MVHSHSAVFPHETPFLRTSASARYPNPPLVPSHIRSGGCRHPNEAMTHLCFLIIFPNHRNERSEPGAGTANEIGRLIPDHADVLTRGNLGSWIHILLRSRRYQRAKVDTEQVNGLLYHILPFRWTQVVIVSYNVLVITFFFSSPSPSESIVAGGQLHHEKIDESWPRFGLRLGTATCA